MSIEFNTNISLLMGGTFCGSQCWNKSSSSIDNCFKLYYVRNGSAFVSQRDNSKKLETGKLYYINGYKLDIQQANEPFMVDWVHFLPKSLYINYTLKQSDFVIQLSMEDYLPFMQIFKQFKSFFSVKTSETERRLVQMEIQSLIYFTITKIFRKVDPEILQKDEKLFRLTPALDYIAENYTFNISLAELAQKCCLSPNYFHRIFAEIFHITPLNYIRELRMDEAIRQLVYTNCSVKEISHNIGYDDDAYFSRIFSKLFNTSPGHYRKRFNKHIP